MPTVPRRLASLFKPENYTLFADFSHSKSSAFSGRLTLDGQALKDGSRVLLHADNLQISAIQVTTPGLGPRPASWQMIAPDILSVNCPAYKKGQRLTIRLDYSGLFSDGMVGVYRCRPQLDDQSKIVIATQFESHYARRAFPCIDEPRAKAVFHLIICSVTGAVVLSNMPEFPRRLNHKSTEHCFQPTPPMSPYLLAWAIGDLHHLKKRTSHGLMIRTWATKSKYPQTAYALDAAVRAIDYLEEYFGIAYPLPKLDLLALSDFSAGAMENWGLCTFRETVLLIDAHSSLVDRQEVVQIVAHELAHQWFGNLVTIGWWDDLWLNEGFARWMEYQIPAHLYPRWHLKERFLATDYAAAVAIDRLPSAQPIRRRIRHPQDIASSFDAISYDKGAIIVAMLSALIGPQSFRKAISVYLQRFSYRNVTSSQLWKLLAQESGQPIGDFVRSWTQQRGFPLIRVEYTSGELYRISQEAFESVYDSSSTDKSLRHQRWIVPIGRGRGLLLMSETERFVTLTGTRVSVLNAINPAHRYYFTTYTENSELSVPLSSYPMIDLIGYLQDSFLLVKSGYLRTSDVLDQLLRLKPLPDASLWIVISSNLRAVDRILMDGSNPRWRKYLWTMIESSYKKVKWNVDPRETDDLEILRPMILSLAVRSRYPQALRDAHKLYHQSGLAEVHPSVKPVLLQALAIGGNAEMQKQFIESYRRSDSQVERQILEIGITAFESWPRTRAALEIVLSETVRSQDLLSWTLGILAHSRNRSLIWQWLLQNCRPLLDKIGRDDTTLALLPHLLARFVSSPGEKRYWSSFIAQPELTVFRQSIRQGRDIISWQLAWRRRDRQALLKWLRAKPITDRQSAARP